MRERRDLLTMGMDKGVEEAFGSPSGTTRKCKACRNYIALRYFIHYTQSYSIIPSCLSPCAGLSCQAKLL